MKAAAASAAIAVRPPAYLLILEFIPLFAPPDEADGRIRSDASSLVRGEPEPATEVQATKLAASVFFSRLKSVKANTPSNEATRTPLTARSGSGERQPRTCANSYAPTQTASPVTATIHVRVARTS